MAGLRLGTSPGDPGEPSIPGSICLHFLSGLQGVPWGESVLSLPRGNTPNQTDFPQTREVQGGSCRE